MIPQRHLSLLSNRLARAGGRRIPEAVLDRDYCLSWLLVGLSQSPLRERLLFKGGTALKKCYFPDYRFSEDLDFTLAQPVALETIRRELEEPFEVAYRASGVVLRYARDDRHPHANSYTFYHLPEDATIRVYSLPEIGAEKVVALLDRARNEPRDLYDLWHLTAHGHVSLDQVIEAVGRKLQARGQELKGLRGVIREKEGRYRRLWATRLSTQVAILPDFDQVFRGVRRALRQVGVA